MNFFKNYYMNFNQFTTKSQEAVQEAQQLAITNGQQAVETAHLLRSTKNTERLLAALCRARSDTITPTSLADLQKQVGTDA